MSKRPLMALVPAAALALIPGLAVAAAHADIYVQPQVKVTADVTTYSAAGDRLTADVAVTPLPAGWTAEDLGVTCNGVPATKGPEVVGTLWSGTYSFQAPDAESVDVTCSVTGRAVPESGLSEDISATSSPLSFTKKVSQATLALADNAKTEFEGADDFKGLLTVTNNVDDILAGYTVSFGEGIVVDPGPLPASGKVAVDLPKALVDKALVDGRISFTAQLMRDGEGLVGKAVTHEMVKKADPPPPPAKSNLTVKLTAVDATGKATEPVFSMALRPVFVAAEVCGTQPGAVTAAISFGSGPEQYGTVDQSKCLRTTHTHVVEHLDVIHKSVTVTAQAYEKDTALQPVEASTAFTWTEPVAIDSPGVDVAQRPGAGDVVKVPISLGNGTGMELDAQVAGGRLTFEDGQHESGTLSVSTAGNDAAATAEVKLTADEASAMAAVIPVTVSVWEPNEGNRAGVRAAIAGVDPAAVTTFDTVLEVPLNLVTPSASPSASAAAKSGTSSVPKTGARVYGVATLAAVALMLGAEMIHRSNRRAGRID